jgi:hypothetical protein
VVPQLGRRGGTIVAQRYPVDSLRTKDGGESLGETGESRMVKHYFARP